MKSHLRLLQENATQSKLSIIHCPSDWKIQRILRYLRSRHELIKSGIRQVDIDRKGADLIVGNLECELRIRVEEVLMESLIDRVAIGGFVPRQTKRHFEHFARINRQVNIRNG